MTERMETMNEEVRKGVAMCGANTKCLGITHFEESDSYLVSVHANSEDAVRLAAVTAHVEMHDILNGGRVVSEVQVTATSEDSFYAGVVLNSNGTIRYFI